MALVLATTITVQWIVKLRGLVMGLLTAGSAARQLVFLPTMAAMAQSSG
jgi:hypothetical protein